MNKPQNRFGYRVFALLLSFSILVLSACSDDTSPEQQVRDTIDAARQAAESRDLSDFRAFIAEDFRDAQGHDRATVSRIAAGYFLQNKNIHLFTRINDIHFPSPAQAEVQLYVAMTGQTAVDTDSILNLRADLYQFDIRLINQDGDWLIDNARWKRVSQDMLN